MSISRNDTPPRTPLIEAGEWLIELQDPHVSRERQEAFADWLRRSPVNVGEFLQLTALQGDLARLPEIGKADVAALLAEGSQAGEIVELDPITRTRKAQATRAGERKRRAPLRLAALAATIVAAAGLVVRVSARTAAHTERYRTETGEQRSLLLADGSRVQLNVLSSLTAKVDDRARDIRLESGEALFEVARDLRRPFRVRTPEASIEATGTQFNVKVKERSTFIALLEGRVIVKATRGGDAVTLSPGEEISIDAGDGRAVVRRSADPGIVTAWTERRLVFDDATLEDVVAEFNRYSRQPLDVEDPALRKLRITASFDSGSVQAFADTLALAGELKVSRQSDGRWLIER